MTSVVGLAFLGSLTLSLLLTPLARRAALRLDLVDRPEGRKRHLLTTPLLGGVAVFLAFASVVTAGLFGWEGGGEDLISLDWRSLGMLVLVGGGLMTLTGLVDDMLGLRPLMKLVLHTLSALVVGFIFVYRGALLDLFITGGGAAWLAAPLTILWLVGITNSMNLLDHADGLASGTGAIAAVFFAIINLLAGNYAVAFVSAALAGAAAGFLVYNFTPASIFMGDSGSNLIGFMLGIIAVLGVYTREGSIREIAVLAPLLVLAVPLMDTAFVLLYRRKSGRPLFGADRNHLAHRLMRLGLTHREAVQVLLVVSALMGILALLLPTLAPYQAVLVLCHALGLVGLFSFFIRTAEKLNRPGEGG